MKLRGVVISLLLLTSFIFLVNFVFADQSIYVCDDCPCSVNFVNYYGEYSKTEQCWVNPFTNVTSLDWSKVEDLNEILSKNIYNKEIDKGLNKVTFFYRIEADDWSNYQNENHSFPEYFELWESDSLFGEFNVTISGSNLVFGIGNDNANSSNWTLTKGYNINDDFNTTDDYIRRIDDFKCHTLQGDYYDFCLIQWEINFSDFTKAKDYGQSNDESSYEFYIVGRDKEGYIHKSSAYPGYPSKLDFLGSKCNDYNSECWKLVLNTTKLPGPSFNPTSDWMKNGQAIDEFIFYIGGIDQQVNPPNNEISINFPGLQSSSQGTTTGNVILTGHAIGNPITYSFHDYYIGKQLNVSIYYNDSSGTKTLLKKITGTVDSNGNLNVIWDISNADFENMGVSELTEDEGPFYFYYGVEYLPFNDEKIFYDKILNVSIIDGVASIDLSNAEGEWRSISTNTEITSFKFNADLSENEVVLYVSNINAPAGSNVKFEIYESDGFLNADDDIRVGTNNLTATFNSQTGIAYATWNITPEDIDNAKNCVGPICDNGPWEFYFKVIVESSTEKRFNNELLEVSEGEITCGSISICSDYKEQSYCNSDTCSVANQSVPSQLKVDCNSVTCFCEWISAQERCQFGWRVDGVGSCAYSDGDLGGDTCDDDGYLTYSWNAIWSWVSGNSYTSQQACESAYSSGECIQINGVWRYDPNKDSEKCVDISGAFLCPAKAKLPGFNWINLLIALLVLAIVYYFLINKKANSKKKATSSKKKK